MRAAWSPRGDVASIAFLTEYPLDPSRAAGAYYVTTTSGARAGSYVAVPDNPAIGANLLLGDAAFPNDGTQPSVALFVLGLQHDGFGRISALCVSPTTNGVPFALVRAF